MSGHREDFIALDGLRGVGALCVLLAHAIYAEEVSYFFASASFGVDMFFVLSGFVIANAYQRALQTSMKFSDYLRVRTLRLYPTIFIGAVLSLVLAIVWCDVDVADFPFVFLMQALVIPVIGHGAIVFPFNGAYWSLFFEVFANFVHAAFAKYVTGRRLGYVAVGGAVGLAACALHWGHLNLGSGSVNFVGGFARVTYSFAIGLLLHDWRKSGALRAPRVHVVVPLVVLVVGMAAPVPDWPHADLVHDLIATLVVSPAIVVLAINARTPARLAPFMSWLGLISYPLYALHMPILDAFAGALAPETVPKHVKALGWALVMGLCVFLAWVVAAFYEQRARRWLERVLPRPERRELAGA